MSSSFSCRLFGCLDYFLRLLLMRIQFHQCPRCILIVRGLSKCVHIVPDFMRLTAGDRNQPSRHLNSARVGRLSCFGPILFQGNKKSSADMQQSHARDHQPVGRPGGHACHARLPPSATTATSSRKYWRLPLPHARTQRARLCQTQLLSACAL